jgi:hypothetical protein
MSDGPHKSLNLAQHWKNLAARADNAAYSDDDAQEQFRKALLNDWIKGIPRVLKAGIAAILDGSNGSLFPADRVERLRQLDCHAAGHELGRLYLDHAIHMAVYGRCSSADVVSFTLRSWGARRARQIEEHYFRKAGGECSNQIRSRLERACEASANHGLANQAIGEPGPVAIGSNRKKTGLDDGVTL